ncbi:MAG: DUF2807 domain-containing protein [Spirosomaceae bacterium]|jgi:hypothetical protein|nr:DUF2807 domain-containing protein [Spirosomataceae bacterium]
MKKLTLIILSIIASVIVAEAQKGPLRGSGRVVSKSFDFKGFDKVSFEDFDGKIEVEIGKPFSIHVTIDDNLEPLLRVEKDDAENQLKLWLENNKNGRLYLEDTHIKIKVSLPESSIISHRGNSIVKIVGIVGRYFRLENNGNGNVYLAGRIDDLDIIKLGNGEVKAQDLIAKTAKVKSYGNGNVLVYSQISMKANGTGNCSVIQFGPGKIESMSGIVGNGEVRKM